MKGACALTTLLATLGAEVIPLGKSESFMPVDTEAVSEETLKLLQQPSRQPAQQRTSPRAARSQIGGKRNRSRETLSG